MAPALMLPQPGQAHGGTQLQRPRLLTTGDVQGALQSGFRLGLWCLRLAQEQNALEASDFRFPSGFVMLLYQNVGPVPCLEADFWVAQMVRDFLQQEAKPWNDYRRPSRSAGSNPPADPGDPFLALALHGQRPAPPAHAHVPP
jgi:hypothetical protein